MNQREIRKILVKISLLDIDENCKYCNKLSEAINNLISGMDGEFNYQELVDYLEEEN